MANQDTSSIITHSFTKGMVKDLEKKFLSPDTWTHARNVVNKTKDGDLGVLSNEMSNYQVLHTEHPYIIGCIHLQEDKWVIFSTDNSFSEIGVYDDKTSEYKIILKDPALNFNNRYLITGAVKRNYDNTLSVYWADGYNPDRKLNITDGVTDIDKLRISEYVTIPSVNIKKSVSGGTLPDGSYQVYVAYSIKGIQVTDYIAHSDIQTIFEKGGLDISISNIDGDFDEIKVVVLYSTEGNTQSILIGYYPSQTSHIYFGNIGISNTAIPMENIFLKTPSYDKSSQISSVGDYLLRIGPSIQSDYNYQPSANKIRTKWVAVKVPSDYYAKGGNKLSYMSDENYMFFIEGIYRSGKTTASYYIPGRKLLDDDESLVTGQDNYSYFTKDASIDKKWQVYNTATVDSVQSYKIEEGEVIMEGQMGYNESTERYPSNKEVWGELSGNPITSHRFPDRNIVPLTADNGKSIIILGVKFENIQPFKDQNGNVINDITGYRILRADRKGNKTVVAKGIINNMREYIHDEEKWLYPNYPYNDLGADNYLVEENVTGNDKRDSKKLHSSYSKINFTFHSPDTSFKNPDLSVQELNIESELFGEVTGQFKTVDKHPKHRLLEDYSVYISGVIATALALTAINGKKKITKTKSGDTEATLNPRITLGSSNGIAGIGGTIAGAGALTGLIGGSGVISSVGRILGNPIVSMGLNAVTGGLYGIAKGFLKKLTGKDKDTTTVEREQGELDNLPQGLLNGNNGFLYTYFLTQGFDKAMEIIENSVPYRQYAYQYISHCLYTNSRPVSNGTKRRRVEDISYIKSKLHNIGSDKINNVLRYKTVTLKLNAGISDPAIRDNSRQTIGSMGLYDNPTKKFKTTSSCYYGSLKVKNPSQYGNLHGVIQIPVSGNVQSFKGDKPVATPVLYGGDIYITKYSEKNTQFFFNDWLHGEPDGSSFNYNLHQNIPYTRYWINSEPYDSSEVVQSFVKTISTIQTTVAAGSAIGSMLGDSNLGASIGNIIGGGLGTFLGIRSFNDSTKPQNYYSLDLKSGQKRTSFSIKNGVFYLFNSGIREFFVESEINCAYRDKDDLSETDIKTVFHSDNIKKDNYFKYNSSLSATNLISTSITRNQLLPRDYSVEQDKRYREFLTKRIIYSLPQSLEYKGDNWSKFLINNYKDFNHSICSVKQIGKSGAVILFKDASPILFQGVDTLQTTGGTKITIGDGGLFNQPLQHMSNSDGSYQYGSCQSKYSVVSTPVGIYYLSEDQGRIFNLGEGLSEITEGNKFWLSENLPSKLLTQFPDYDLKDNPVIGIGTISGYDNTYGTIYFSKRDFSIKDEYKDAKYIGNNKFRIGTKEFDLGDSEFFDDSSFTLSYDPYSKAFISFHDWIPELTLSSRDHLITSKRGELWKHNDINEYCEFYNVNYPWEIEFCSSTGQVITTLRSVEYELESWVYPHKNDNKFQILDDNFDIGVIYNNEQCSGLLKFVKQEKNQPILLTQGYNKDDLTEVFWAKNENKIRFNTFYDLQRDRMEYSKYNPNPIWFERPNGYTKDLNPIAIDYKKNLLQRKKFRHNHVYVFLRKNYSKYNQYLLKVFNTKHLISLR